MRYFNQAGAHALATSQETVLGWTISRRTPDTNENEPQYTYLSREDNSLKSNLKRFCEVEAVEQSTMTAEQQAC